MAQNWNNLLTYIKHELGAPVNAIELLDSEIQTHIVDVVMPDFSQYIGNSVLYMLKQSMLITMTGTRSSAFKLPIVATGTEITRIQNVYYDSANSGITATINASSGLVSNPADLMQSTVMADMIAYLQPIKSYFFNKPDIIVFNKPVLTDLIMDLDVVHTNPNTIPGDMYIKAFRKMALVSVIDYIVAIRSKFSTVQTPLGEINLNIEFLTTKADRLREEFQRVLDDIPPDPLVEFII